MRKNSIEYL